MAENDLGEYYTIPVILSFEGIDKQVNRSLGPVLGAAGKKGGADFGKQLSEGIKASESDVKRALDNHAKLADRAADATDKLKVAQTGYNDLVKKGVTEGQRYERAKAAVAKATRDETRAINTAKDALKEYEDAAKRAKSAGEDAGTGFLSGLRGAVSGATGAGSEAASSFAEGFAGSAAILRLGSAGGPIGLALAAAGTIGGGLLAKNILAGLEREPAKDLIQAQLGIDEAAMSRISIAAGKAYANNFGESVAGEMDVARRAIQGGLLNPLASPEEMQPVIEQLTAVNNLIEGDLTTTTKAASVLMRNGLAKDAEEAFDIIVKGYQKSGNLGDDLIDSISEYGSGWKNTGLTAQQALALIQQSVDMGVDNTDRGADALREFGRRVSEEGDTIVAVLDNIGLDGQAMFDKFKQGGPAAFEAFDQVFDKIRGIEDPVKRNQAAMALLGDTAGDFIGTFAQWDPSKAVNDFGAVDGAAQGAADTMGDNVVGSFESAKRSIELSLDNVQDKLAEVFGPELEKVAGWVKEHEADIAGFFVDLGVVAISGAQSVLQATGEITVAIGQLVGGVGNVVGVMDKFQAWQADIRGDHETANELRAQAEEAFSWGENLQKLGDDMIDNAGKMDGWKDSLRDLEGNAGDAGGETKGLNDELNNLPDKKDVAINLTDGQGNPWPMSGGLPLPPGITGAPPAPDGGNPLIGGVFATPGAPPTPPAGLPSGIGGTSGGRPAPGQTLLGAAGASRKVGSDKGLQPATIGVKDQIATAFSDITDIGGWRPPDGYNEHSSGQAIDVMIPGWNTPAGKTKGDEVAAKALQNPAVDYVIWRQRTWYPDGTSKAMSDRGSPTQNHYDHVHVHTRKGAQASGGERVAKSSGFTGGGQDGALPGLGDAQGLNQSGPVSPNLVNAFGTGYEPGIGTPGYNEYGEPGYYETDPRQIAQADRRVEDTQKAITDADQRIADAKTARAELEEDLTTTAEDRVKADRVIADAEEDAARAREDAVWAQQDAAEARQGKFSSAKQAKKQSGQQGEGGMAGLGELGSIAGSFLKETLGIDGSFLPDLSSLMPVQMAGAALNAFSGPLQGLIDGKLGIQQPGWTPEMGDPALMTGGSTSGGAFGMPDVVPPPMPAGDAHTGTGTPGPPTVINHNNVSTNVQGNVGMDPVSFRKEQQRAQDRGVARLTGFGAGLK